MKRLIESLFLQIFHEKNNKRSWNNSSRPGFSMSVNKVNGRCLVTFLMILFISAISVNAQTKIYIVTDLEGVSGVYKFSQTREKDTPLNIQACEYYMGDLAAVVRGLRDGGATEILINDGHGSQSTIPHLMVPGAKYITGKPRTSSDPRWSLDSTYAGVVMFGFHSMMGTPDGILNHTQNSKSENKYWYNGVESGELAQSGASAGRHNVPPILVTGDEATCREARKFFGDGFIGVPVKAGLGREAAVLYPFEETRKALYEGAKKAIAAIPECKPYKLKLPVRCKMQYLDLDPSLPEPKLITKEWVSPDGSKLYGP